ncbi:virulence factor Mce family protein Precursor [Mangrovactinospora gilvigrisea]|uniref:Virulence factor Mce family protein n=1 Tax=Mangrovactinospora gilvigrisea TaxID=1428644 RepID=A0A1J7C390_9ACTN|nr:MCE family protein [Mangrovactinospora gilvigrisea]OIV36028.1 virulence factor Mce family protein Precursor [Mangrovactinospora gilvigrisea]
MRRRLAAALAATTAATTALLAAGCSGAPDLAAMPLPGGASLGSHPYTVTADFSNVLDLTPQSAVKVNDVAVGRVAKIGLAPDGWTARVTLRINDSVTLPANAYAHIEQSSLLGEKYVQLAPPATGSTGRLANGAVIPTSRTNRDPQVEEVLGALSMLLNGGGINQLKSITTQLNAAMHGNEPQMRAVLTRINSLATGLDTHRGDITDAIDGVNRLSATLAARQGELGDALTGLSPGMKVLSDQRGQLMTMLGSLDKLSGTAVHTVNQTQDDLVADLRSLEPVLTTLAAAGKNLPNSLQVLLTYPFTDQVLRGIKGDYLNLYLDVAAQPGTQIIPAITPSPTASASPSGSASPSAAARARTPARTPARATPGTTPVPLPTGGGKQ